MNISLVRAQILRIVAIAAISLGASFASPPVSAQVVYHGFVKDEYYLGRGGKPATLEQVADNPLRIFRSEAVYMNLRAHVGSYLGQPLTDEDFRALLRSDGARLVPCVGTIDTAGVSDTGRFGWRVRNCYRGESLIQIRLTDGRWVTVASQGCYNPVRGELPPPIIKSVLQPPPPPPPVKRVSHCHVVEVPFENGPDYVVSTPGQLIQVQCGNQTLWLPGLSVNTGGSTGAAYKLVCHEVDEQALSSEGH